MGWSRSKKIILIKPYLIDPYREISLKVANKQWQKSGYPNKDSLLKKAAILTENAEVRNKLLKYQTKKTRAYLVNGTICSPLEKQAWLPS